MNLLITLNALLIAAVIGLAAYITDRDKFNEPPVGSSPQVVAEKFMDLPIWGGSNSFYRKHDKEIKNNLVMDNFFEHDAVGVAFIKTTAGEKSLKRCIWMKKWDANWELLLSAPNSSTTGAKIWSDNNKAWAQEMVNKCDAWETSSESFW